MPPQSKPDPDAFMKSWNGKGAPSNPDEFMKSWGGRPAPADLSAQNAKINHMREQSQIPENYGFTIGNVLKNAMQGAESLATGTYALGKDLVQNPNWVTGPNSTLQKFVINPSNQQTIEAGQALNQGQTIPALGHALASAIPFVGPWAASLGEQAGRGDMGGAVGQAAGTAIAGEIGREAVTRGPAAVEGLATKGGLEALTGTTPERIAELAQIPGKMARVSAVVSSAEKAARARAAAEFPTIENPVTVHTELLNEPTGLVDQFGQPITRTVEKSTKVPFSDLQKQYSELGEAIANEKEAVKSGAPAFELKRLIAERQSVNDLMTKAASEEGKLGGLDAARAKWKEFEDDFHNPGSPMRRLLSLRPDQTAEIAGHLGRGTNAARIVEILKRNGMSPAQIQALLQEGRKPLAVNVTESGKLRAAGSPEAYRTQRFRESLRQATTNEIPTDAEARLPAWSMRRQLPGIFGQLPISPREITAWRLRRALAGSGGGP